MMGMRPTMGSNVPCRRLGTPGRKSAPDRSGSDVQSIGSFKSDLGYACSRCEPSVDSPSAPSCPSRCRRSGELAGNLRWSWHPETQDLFAAVDPGRLGGGRPRPGPAARRGPAGPARRSWPRDAGFLRRLERAARRPARRTSTGDRWYQTLAAGDARAASIAYFSPEFGITAVLPQYSGGLGILAGDHLKAASDLGVPLIGVGLLYRHGYFRQSLSPRRLAAGDLPGPRPRRAAALAAARRPTARRQDRPSGCPASRALTARIWVAQVGRVPLLLLDSDVEENSDADARRHRPAVRRHHRAPAAPGDAARHRRRPRDPRATAGSPAPPAPEVFHTNEGHAGFLGLERIRELTEDQGLDFDAALEVSRAGTVFTTHTPVPAGIDRFPRELIAAVLRRRERLPGRARSTGSSRSAPRTTRAATPACSTWP